MPPSESYADEQELVKLQEQVTHQSIMLEDLSKIVTSQHDELDLLRKQMKLIYQRFENLEEAVAPATETTKPPHY